MYDTQKEAEGWEDTLQQYSKLACKPFLKFILKRIFITDSGFPID
jgi:hypothetical protein